MSQEKDLIGILKYRWLPYRVPLYRIPPVIFFSSPVVDWLRFLPPVVPKSPRRRVVPHLSTPSWGMGYPHKTVIGDHHFLTHFLEVCKMVPKL